MIVEFLSEYGLFLAKAITIVAAVLIIAVGMFSMAQSHQHAEPKGNLSIKKLNEHYKSLEKAMLSASMDHKALKAYDKQKKKEEKSVGKGNKKSEKTDKKHVYVLDFDGDIKASATEHLREEISALLTTAKAGDEVVLRLESGGGMVHAYGLAASQLDRIKQAGVSLTICVDKVAASGGYMMACLADKLIAAPFAILGSIGVVAQLPNFHRLLKNHDIDVELLTAGEYKRTLTMFGENTEAGRAKFIADLEDTHTLFKGYVQQYRPSLNIEQVANGDTWYGSEAVDNNLIDEIGTSDEYIMQCTKSADVYHLRYTKKRNWQEKLGVAAESAMNNSIDRLFAKGERQWESKH